MRVSYIELLGAKHPMCFSLTAATELDEAFGGLDAMSEQIQSGGLAARAVAINKTLEILMRAGRIYASASGMELPDPISCRPADLIDVTDGSAVRAIFSAISGDMEREVETVEKNGEATQGR